MPFSLLIRSLPFLVLSFVDEILLYLIFNLELFLSVADVFFLLLDRFVLLSSFAAVFRSEFFLDFFSALLAGIKFWSSLLLSCFFPESDCSLREFLSRLLLPDFERIFRRKDKCFLSLSLFLLLSDFDLFFFPELYRIFLTFLSFLLLSDFDLLTFSELLRFFFLEFLAFSSVVFFLDLPRCEICFSACPFFFDVFFNDAMSLCVFSTTFDLMADTFDSFSAIK